jgi:hypothetical protein
MATAGLSFANPFLAREQAGAEVNPFAPNAPTSQIGMGGLAPSAADMAVFGQQMAQQNQFRMPEMKAPPSIAYSPSQRKLFVQGNVFDEDDAATALQTERLLTMPGTGLPQGGDWVPLGTQEFGQYLETIRSPGRGRLFTKGFSTGVSQLQQLGGSALQLMGAEETGGRIVERAEQDIAKLAPYAREFTDVEFGSADKGVIDWFVATLGTQGPMLLESVAASLAGAAIGTATAGPGVGTVGGVIVGAFGKAAFKKKVLEAAGRYRAGKALPDDLIILRNASAVTGAAAGNFVSSQAIGAGDIYGEMREQGVDPDDFAARMTAIAGSFPYALAETITEFAIAGRALGAGGRAALPPTTTRTVTTPAGTQTVREGPSLLRRGVEYPRRALTGAAVYGGAEGLTEIIQEGLVMGLSGQSLTDDEAVKRFVNAFAAGAAVGGTLGGVANLRSRSPEEVNLLSPGVPRGEPVQEAGAVGRPDFVAGEQGTRPSVPSDTLVTGEVAPGQFGPQGVLYLGGAPISELQQRSRETGSLPPQQVWNPDTAQWEFRERPGMVSPLDGQPIITSERVALPAPEQAGVQGQQLPLQFAPPAPEGIGFTEQQPVPNTLMAQQMQAAQRRQEIEQAQQQRAQQLQAKREQQMNLLAQQAATARDRATYEAERAAREADVLARRQARQAEPAAPAPVQPPMRPVPVRQPQQLPLFTPAQAPVPSRAEGLRRGVGTQITPAGAVQQPTRLTTTELDEQGRPRVVSTDVPPLTPQEARRAGQIPLITQTGEPSVAALRAASLRRPLPLPVVEAGAKTTKPTGKKVTPESKAKARAEAEKKEAERKERAKKAADRLKAKAKEKEDAVQEPSAKKVPTRKASETGAAVGAKVSGKKQAAAKGEKLKKGKPKQEPVTKATDDEFERVLNKYNALTGAQRNQVASRLGVTRQQMPDLLDERTADVNAAIDAVLAPPPQEAAGGRFRGKTAYGDLTAAERKEVNDAIQAIRDFALNWDLNTAGLTETQARNILDKYGIDVIGEAGQVVDASDPFLWRIPEEFVKQRKFNVIASVPAFVQYRKDGSMRILEAGFGVELAEQATSAGKRRLEVEAAKAAQEQVSPSEAWDAMDTGTRWAELSPEQQQRWADSDRLQDTADAIAQEDTVELTPLQSVEADIRTFEEATSNTAEKADALRAIVRVAFFTSEETNTNAAVMRARQFLETVSLSDTEKNSIDALVISETNNKQNQTATYSDDARKGMHRPWFNWANKRGLLRKINTTLRGLDRNEAVEFIKSGQLRMSNLPTSTQKYVNTQLAAPVTEAAPSPLNDTVSNPAKSLADLIAEINKRSDLPNEKQRNAYTAKLTALWEAAQEAGFSSYLDQFGVTLDSYFDEDGKPITNRVGGRWRVNTEVLSDEKRKRIEDDISGEVDPDVAIAEQTEDKATFRLRYSFEDWNNPSGRTFRDDGTAIDKPLPIGRVRMLVSNFLSRLGVKPKVKIYKNQADFKAKNSTLYAQAVAARPQGDFDTVSAVGYSFGDGQIVLFSDRVVTEKQLRFVLAHEALGHFGFRGLLTEKQLNAALNQIYNSSPKVKAAADTMVETLGMGRLEAVEEYMADYAGVLDTNVLARFWNQVKNALNKLGFQFEDDMVRYLVSQSRAYVRNGTTNGQFIDFRNIMQRMAAIEGMNDPDGSGRFALAAPYYDEVNQIAADHAFGRRSQNFWELSNIWQEAKDKGTNISDLWERVRTEFTTMNYLARENQGYRRLYEVLRDTVRGATELRTKYNDMMRTILSPAVEVAGRKWTNGATRQQIDTVNSLLRLTSRFKHGQLTDNQLRKLGSLIQIVDGEAMVNPEVYAALRNRGTLTFDQLKNGFTYKELRERPMTEAKRNELRAERDAALVGVEDAKERKAIEREYDSLIEAPSGLFEVEVKFDGIKDLDKDGVVWKMYNEVRSTMDESAMDLLLANYAAAKGEQGRIQTIAQTTLNRELTEADKAFIETVSDKYLAIRAEGAKVNDKGEVVITKSAEDQAQQFIRNWNEALLADRDDKYQSLLSEFLTDKEFDDYSAGLNALKQDSKIVKKGDQRFAIQQAIQNLALTETSKVDAEMHAKRTITGGYVPFGREGSWQVRIQVVDAKTGQVYKASDDYRKQLMFIQTSSKADAERIAENTNELFTEGTEDGLYDMEVWDGEKMAIKKVRLVAQPETARQTVGTTSEANINEVVQVLTRFGLNITPAERRRLVVAMTNQNARARNRLQRLGAPGEDTNTLKYVSQHLESVASTVARKQNRHRLDRLFTDGDPESEKLWRGDQVEYDRRKKAWEDAQKDPNMPAELRKAIKQEYIDYHYTFITKDSRKLANRYKDRGRRLVAFLESQTAVEYTDFASGETGSQLRMWTTFAQLGGSFATGLLNIIALNTNVLPALAGRNDKNGFGGGFGWGRASTSLVNAMKQVANAKQSDVNFWNELLADPKKLEASGFTEAEARFMQKEISAGSMQAALMNALLGSARGKITTGAKQAFVRTWMSLFSYTEQAARRATGLATFRLEFDRALQEGQARGLQGADLQQFAFDKADRAAVDMIENTLGEYAMFNRPAFFRGDVRQFLFIYKMFPVNSVLMLSAMDRKTQLLALGILSLYAGLKGMPLAEDMMDLIDTIAQWLGLGPGKVWKGSAEKTVLEALDAILPGASPVLWRGVVNSITPANVSDRVSLSNLIPGTGIGLAGANTGREFMDIAGPIASFAEGTLTTASNIGKYALETVGLREDTTTLTQIMRQSPVTMMRAVGDMAAYNTSGAVVNQKGYVVTEDLHWYTYLARALGFYPASAVRENDVVRVANRLASYQRDISGTYRSMYVAAMLAGNNERALDVLDMVRDWNDAARGTGLEIRNFTRSANQALREARRPAAERYLRSTSRGMRPETERIRYLFGLDED